MNKKLVFLIVACAGLFFGFLQYASAEVIQPDLDYEIFGSSASAFGISFASGTLSHVGTTTLGIIEYPPLQFFRLGWNCTTPTVANSPFALDNAGCSNVIPLSVSSFNPDGKTVTLVSPNQDVMGLVMIGWSHTSGGSFTAGWGTNTNTNANLGYCTTSAFPCSATNLNPMPYISIDSLALPMPINLQQFKSDATSTIAEGGTTTEDAVVFGATLDSSSTNQLRLEVEYTTSTSFAGIPNATSSPVNPGSAATITVQNLQNGNYHWRARAVDASTTAASGWQEFGTPGNTDFIVNNLGQNAASLAKQLVNSVYLYGGKGWDYNLSQFVSPSTVTSTGYNYWNQASGSVAFGQGVDCSGLVMWAFDRSFDPNKSRFNNFVKAEGADEQFRENTTSTTESQLKLGDVMFFDFDSDNFMDHVAMYVGEGGGFDVVSAVDRDTGIAGRLKNNLKQPSAGFVAFKHVVSALPPSRLAVAHSPVDLIITDPDGFTITPTTTVASNLEYLREIPGVLYYSEMEKGTDGNPIDQVYSYTAKTGDYIIKVLPAANASPTFTYSLDFSAGNQSTTLAANVPINQIPSQGYGITVSSTQTLQTFIPVAIDIKPGSFPNNINLGSNGVVPVAIFGSATLDVHQIDPLTIKLANASVKLKGNGQPQVNYSDVNGDGFTDITVHVLTDALQLTLSDVKADLEGQLTSGGTTIKGSDSVRIVP